MSNNPLEQYFRQATIYLKLPTLGIWYSDGSVELTENQEVPIYPLSALDDILLNTPDAMLNGQSLEKVVLNCVPSIKNIKKLLLPDLEAIFVGIKSATNNGKMEYERKCKSCGHDNTFELNLSNFIDQTVFVDESMSQLRIDEELLLFIKPYDFEMRQMFIKKEFEEEKLMRSLDSDNSNLDELAKAKILGESVDRLSKTTFDLVSRSIEKITIIKDNKEITDKKFINQWLINISKEKADLVIESVNQLNSIGIPKNIPIVCQNCQFSWEDTISFDPASFFGKRS